MRAVAYTWAVVLLSFCQNVACAAESIYKFRSSYTPVIVCTCARHFSGFSATYTQLCTIMYGYPGSRTSTQNLWSYCVPRTGQWRTPPQCLRDDVTVDTLHTSCIKKIISQL
ncbi:hypothetical protein V1521DRAFT_426922 [Lipomyces starkeyi]